MKKSILASIFLSAAIACVTTKLHAQTPANASELPVAKNSVNVNGLLGASMTGIGYERLIYQSSRHKLFASLHYGLSVIKGSDRPFTVRYEWTHAITPGLDYSYSLGKNSNRHHLDFGVHFSASRAEVLTGTLASSSPGGVIEENVAWQPSREQLLLPRIGYRYRKPEGGFTWQGGIYPVIYHFSRPADRLELFPLPHVSIGWSF